MKTSVPFVLMRGGTSKGVFFRSEDVPSDTAQLKAFILDAFGSPDRRQIDGLGGADKLTSKVVVIGPPVNRDSDLTYLYGHVGITVADVDFNANCGNLISAVGQYAIEGGFVSPQEGVTRVRIDNLNTGKIIIAEVPVKDGAVVTEGDMVVAGVPGTGASIGLDFSLTAGSKTNKLLPFDEPLTTLNVPGIGAIEVSVVDLGNLAVYLHAESLGMSGTESPIEIDANADLVARINAIRGVVAHRVGLGDYWDKGGEQATPKLVVVRAPADYADFVTGRKIAASSIDIVCRLYASGSTSKALAATVAACTGAAVQIPGTIPFSIAGGKDVIIRMGHPSGVIETEARALFAKDRLQITTCKIFRTARRIADGNVYLKHEYATARTSATRKTVGTS